MVINKYKVFLKLRDFWTKEYLKNGSHLELINNEIDQLTTKGIYNENWYNRQRN